ncbi:MAG: hypothetical protein HQK49_14705 [Oligoflexia bacterium]|nr:hypothetical protein [Oligoflexia bacterium]
MIEVSIESSPDTEIIGKHRYYKNFIRIGNSGSDDDSISDISGDDILISDSLIINSHLLLEISEDGSHVLAKKNSKIESYLVNDKKTTGHKKIKLGDTITLGKTIIRVLFFEYTKATSKKETLNQNLELIMSDQSFEKVQKIIEFVEEDLSKIKIK